MLQTFDVKKAALSEVKRMRGLEIQIFVFLEDYDIWSTKNMLKSFFETLVLYRMPSYIAAAGQEVVF